MQTTIYFEEEQQGFAGYLNGKQQTGIVLLADAKTNGFCLPVLKELFPQLSTSPMIVIPDGESNKKPDVCRMIWDQLMELQAGRQTTLLNVGGGMVSDMGGFAASVYKRGMPYVNIPTTVLAMADACIGGKTGIDLNGLKNGIGSFCHPEAVMVHTVFLNTLDENIKRSGIAEIIKHALLEPGNKYTQLLDHNEKDFYHRDVLAASVKFKLGIVLQDELDENIRQSLNFGHTIGHAIEGLALERHLSLLHGEAVMLGMLYELQLSHQLLGLHADVLKHIMQLKKNIFPALRFPFTLKEIVQLLLNDKKNSNDIRMSLLSAPGHCQWQTAVSLEQIDRAIANVNKMDIGE